MVPRRVGIGDQIAVRVEGFRLLGCGFCGLGGNGAWDCLGLDNFLLFLRGCSWGSGRRCLGVQRPNLQLLLVLLEDALIMVLPELLRGILARNACKDLGVSA